MCTKDVVLMFLSVTDRTTKDGNDQMREDDDYIALGGLDIFMAHQLLLGYYILKLVL